LVKKGSIRRLKRGLYDYPKIHPKLGELTPSPDVIAEALARKTEVELQTPGALAANALGLTTQVPARPVYLTSGGSKRIEVGRQVIDLRHTTPRNITSSSEMSGMVIQALRYLGRDAVDDEVIRKLKGRLPDEDKKSLKKDSKKVPEWMRQVIAQITSEV
jgi:hypothetical protein